MSNPCANTVEKLSAEAMSSNTALNSRLKKNTFMSAIDPRLFHSAVRRDSQLRTSLHCPLTWSQTGGPQTVVDVVSSQTQTSSPLGWRAVGRGCVSEHRTELEVETGSTRRSCPSNSATPHNLRKTCALLPSGHHWGVVSAIAPLLVKTKTETHQKMQSKHLVPTCTVIVCCAILPLSPAPRVRWRSSQPRLSSKLE